MNFFSQHSPSRIASPALRLKLDAWRSRFALIVCLGLFAVLLGKALYLQAFNNGFLRAKGEARFQRVVDMPASRGALTDRNDKPLAISTPVESVWASPAEMEDVKPEQIAALAKVLGMERAALKARIADTSKDFVWLKRQLPPEQAARAIALAIPGVAQQREFRRFYPAGDVAAHVVGVTSDEDKGKEGIELAQQSVLAGASGQRRVLKDKKGRIVEDIENLKTPRDGKPLRLSIDERLQYIAHRELKAAVETHKAKGGALVLLDARSGEVLALVNQPDFNPNNRADYQPKQMRNRSVTDTFEPGSTFKPFAIAAALEAGIVKSDTILQTTPFMVGNHRVADSHPQAQASVGEIIQRSSNIGTARIALQLPPEKLWHLYNELGFGLVPKTGFPGEASGRLRPFKSWKPVEQATMSYGYGVSVSVLQLARAYSVFTNDGVLLPVTFLRRDNDVIGKQVLSAKTARELSAMLEKVTQQGGTATKGQVAGYRVAGKTGTAWKLVNGQYDTSLYLSSFVGYAPASKPRFIIAVTIDEPSAGKTYGGDVSAPVFANVMAQALRQAGVAPDGNTQEAAKATLLANANATAKAAR